MSLAVALLPLAALAGEGVMLGHFSVGDTDGWRHARFDDIPPSDYRIVTVDGRRALRGRCHDSASLFGVERRVDLTETPVLHWSWRVPQVYAGLDERSRSGDDFPARVYAVIEGGWLPWRTRAINYVWASEVPVGTAWPNPFREQAMMIAVQSGNHAGWVTESRNVRADFRRYFGIEPAAIDGIALMVDCDNHGGRGRAFFGNIRFAP